MKYSVKYDYSKQTDRNLQNLWDNWSSRMWKSVDASEKQGGIIENKLMLKLREQLYFDLTFRIFQ